MNPPASLAFSLACGSNQVLGGKSSREGMKTLCSTENGLREGKRSEPQGNTEQMERSNADALAVGEALTLPGGWKS